MARTRLKNRFPSIIASLDPKVNAALRAGAEAIAVDAKGRVPVDSGALREAIHVDSSDEGHSIVAGDSDVFYGHFVEFGAASRPAHPFLIPAAEANKDTVAAAVGAALRKL